jgi:hypothetical protein
MSNGRSYLGPTFTEVAACAMPLLFYQVYSWRNRVCRIGTFCGFEIFTNTSLDIVKNIQNESGGTEKDEKRRIFCPFYFHRKT